MSVCVDVTNKSYFSAAGCTFNRSFAMMSMTNLTRTYIRMFWIRSVCSLIQGHIHDAYNIIAIL